MRNALAALAFVAVNVMAPPAAADDFVFNVPVRIENADLLADAAVVCLVFYNSTTVGGGFVEGRVLSGDSDGAYSNTVPVTVTLPTGATRADATRWLCRLNLLLAPPGAAQVWLHEGSSELARRGRYTAASGRLVSSSLLEVSGTFSR